MAVPFLHWKINKLRNLMHLKYREKKSFLDPEVYQISCELDRLIIIQQRASFMATEYKSYDVCCS